MTAATFVDGVGVDSIEARADRLPKVPFGRLIKALFLAVPLAVGYLVGKVRRATRLAVASFVYGMERAMEAPAPAAPAASSERE